MGSKLCCGGRDTSTLDNFRNNHHTTPLFLIRHQSEHCSICSKELSTADWSLQINWLDSILTTSPFVREGKRPKMAIFLVDLQFREKAKQVLSSREMFAVVLFLMFALLPWVEIMETAQVMTNSTWWDINAYTMDQSGGEGAGHCNPHTRACL